MKRVKTKRLTKKAITLAELIVAMALTAVFATSCIMLILPVEQIYTDSTDFSRAQIIADSVVDSLRKECANAYIEGEGDVWICDSGNTVYNDAPTDVSGNAVLVFRKNVNYCETIYANGNIPQSVYESFTELSGEEALNNGAITDRAIFSFFSDSDEGIVSTPETQENYIHYGYYLSSGGKDNLVYPVEYYDFTNPFPYATYREYTVRLTFHDIGYTETDSGKIPSYVMCNIEITKNTEAVYSRDTVLCFAAPARS